MNPTLRRQRFLDDHRDLAPGQIVALCGSHRRVAWPPLCPACGAPAGTQIEVAKIFGRQPRSGRHSYYRFIVRMKVPFCGSCAARHQQLVKRMPSVIGSFFRTPALLSFIGAAAVAAILTNIFLAGGEGVSPGLRLYAFGGIAMSVGLGVFLTAREARFLRVPPLTQITSACDFSDNVGFPFGRRRIYAIRSAAFADAFSRANQHRLWTDQIRKRDQWISGLAVAALLVVALFAWFVRQ